MYIRMVFFSLKPPELRTVNVEGHQHSWLQITMLYETKVTATASIIEIMYSETRYMPEEVGSRLSMLLTQQHFITQTSRGGTMCLEQLVLTLRFSTPKTEIT